MKNIHVTFLLVAMLMIGVAMFTQGVMLLPDSSTDTQVANIHTVVIPTPQETNNVPKENLQIEDSEAVELEMKEIIQEMKAKFESDSETEL